MSEALALNPITFDDPPRVQPQSGSLQGSPLREVGVDATERIAETLKAAGVDAPSTLYNEALELAKEGHLGQAASRLQMLLCLDPEDADALLVLSKVLAAQGKYADALARLDAASAAGVLPPAGMREFLEAILRTERVREEEHRSHVLAREQGEIRALRTETRQLRTETMRLENELLDAMHRERTWKLATLGTALFATAVVLALLLIPDKRAAAPDVSDASAASSAASSPAAPAEGSADAQVAKPSAAASQSKPLVKSVQPAVKSAEKPAGQKTMAGGVVHTIQSGDTLYKLAIQYYGDGSRWEEIEAANKSTLKNGKDLALGMQVTIP